MNVRGMNDPITYSRYNQLQHRDNKRFLAENLQKIVWKGNDRVLDIGSGDGSFTANELRPLLPDDIIMVGCDRSKEMVKYANEHYQGEKIKFQVLELGKTLPAEFIGSYDHVFSFFTLHWITDQRKAISQVYNILSDGGDCLLLIVGHFPPIFDVYRCLAQSEKWSRYIKNLSQIISPYHDSKDPEADIKKIADDVGFRSVFTKCTKCSYTVPSTEDFRKMIISINPFAIPEDLKEEYLDEFLKVAKDKGYFSEDLTFNYSSLTFYGRK